MKYLSLETCIQLKDAGFPQPEKAPGQLWYYRGVLCLIYPIGPALLAASQVGDAHFGTNDPEDWVYCPTTALELLAQIPGLAMMRINDGWIFSMPKTFKQLSATFSDNDVAEFLAGFILENEQKINEQ